MIFQITYISGPYLVKGYLGMPSGGICTASELQDMLERHYHGAAELPVSVAAEHVKREEPAEAAEAPPRWPALLYCRGGIGNVGKVRLHWIDSFASRGYVVFAPCYRGNEGGEGRDEFGGADREDVTSAFRLLQALPFVDPGRISLMGFSRGAINAVLTALEAPAPGAHSLVLWGGVSDLARTYEERVDLRRMLKRVVGGSVGKVPEAYRARSPIDYAASIPCPTLIIHGTADVQVDVRHGLRMYHKLKELGRPADLHLCEGYGHLLPYLVHEAAIDRMFDWIKNVPATRAPAPLPSEPGR